MQKNITLRLPLLSSLMEVLTSWKSKKHTIPDKELSSSYRLANKCSQLTMERFMICLCDDDLSALVLEGSVPERSVLDAMWVVIISEYQSLRGDTIDMIEALHLTKLIYRTRHHLFLVDQCVRQLALGWSASIAKSFRDLGYPFNPTSENPEDYAALLSTCVSRSRGKYVQLEGWVKTLANLPVITTKATREQFENTLVAIEELQKVAYTLETMTVSKFIMLENKLKRYVEKWQSKG